MWLFLTVFMFYGTVCQTSETTELKLVAHYSRPLRIKERVVAKRQAGSYQYWQTTLPPYWNQHNYFTTKSASMLDIYIYAPSKHTRKAIGESVHFDCEVTDGYSATWSRENGRPFSQHAETKKLLNRNIYRIDIERLDYSDAGNYICSANTGNPSDKEIVFLEIYFDPSKQVSGGVQPGAPAQPPPTYPPTDYDTLQRQREYERILQSNNERKMMEEQQQRLELERSQLNDEYERARQAQEQYDRLQKEAETRPVPADDQQYWEDYYRQQQLYKQQQQEQQQQQQLPQEEYNQYGYQQPPMTPYDVQAQQQQSQQQQQQLDYDQQQKEYEQSLLQHQQQYQQQGQDQTQVDVGYDNGQSEVERLSEMANGEQQQEQAFDTQDAGYPYDQQSQQSLQEQHPYKYANDNSVTAETDNRPSLDEQQGIDSGAANVEPDVMNGYTDYLYDYSNSE